MGGLTQYLKDELLDHVYRNNAYTSPTTVYVGLFTSAPSHAGGGTEVSAGDYAREAATFGAPSGAGATRQIANSSIVDFGTTTNNWGTVTHFALFDAASAGNMLHWDALTVDKTINTGDPVSFPVGDLIVGITDET
jgi:hypothetical protein